VKPNNWKHPKYDRGQRRGETNHVQLRWMLDLQNPTEIERTLKRKKVEMAERFPELREFIDEPSEEA